MTPHTDRSAQWPVMPIAVLAWLITILVATLTWISIVAYRGSHAPDEPLGELAFLYPLAMALPLGLMLGVVTVPIVTGLRALIGERRLWLALAGAAAAPLAIALVVTGKILLASGVRRTLWEHLATIANDPQGVPPILLALVVGGITIGLGIVHRRTAATL